MQQYVEPTGTAGWQRKANKQEDLSSEVFGFFVFNFVVVVFICHASLGSQSN